VTFFRGVLDVIRAILESVMRTLAVVRADLRSLSRARGLGIERSLFTGVLLLAVALSWPDRTAGSLREMSRFGADVFQAFFITAYIVTAFLVPTLFSGAFAAERRGHQAQLLFTTPFKPFEVVLGRFASRFGRILLIVACGVPVLFSALLFGGVAGKQVLLAVVSILSLSFFLGALTLFISVLSGKGYVAGSATFLLLLGEMFIVSLAALMLQEFLGLFGALDLSLLLMPHFALSTLPLPAAGLPIAWWIPVTEALALGALFLFLSAMLLRPLTLRVRVSETKRKAVKPRLKALDGKKQAPAFSAKYRGPIWKNPLAWKEVMVRSPKGRWLRAILLGLLVLTWMGLMLIVSRDDMHWAHANSILLVLEIIGLTLAAVNHASTAVSLEREEGSLELLAVTPISASQILRGKWAGVLRNLAFLLGLVAVHFLIWGLTSMGPDAVPKLRGIDSWGGFHPMGDLVRFVPLLSAWLVFAFTLALAVSGALFASCFTRRTSTAVTSAMVGLLGWWIGLPLLLAALRWEHILDKTLAFSPVTIVAQWAMTQGSYSSYKDLHSPTLIYLFTTGLLIVVFTILFFPALNRLLGRTDDAPLPLGTRMMKSP